MKKMFFDNVYETFWLIFKHCALLLRSDFLIKNEKNHHSVPKNVNNIGWYVPYDVAFYYIKKVEIFWFSI